MQYPEHTIESYKAAALQGAGIIECDVTFTKDKELICTYSFQFRVVACHSFRTNYSLTSRLFYEYTTYIY